MAASEELRQDQTLSPVDDADTEVDLTSADLQAFEPGDSRVAVMQALKALTRGYERSSPPSGPRARSRV